MSDVAAPEDDYIKPEFVWSPQDRVGFVRVLLNRGPRNCAYALLLFDGVPRIGIRWNGGTTTDPNNRGPRHTTLGNPQSRGMPLWTTLDPALHEAVLSLPEIPEDLRVFAREFLNGHGR